MRQFLKSIKTQYSRLLIGTEVSIINQVFRGRTNLILAISQSGDWLRMITDKKMKSFDCGLFMSILIKTLAVLGTMFRIKFRLFRINVSINHGKIQKKLSTEEHLNILYLPPYHPKLTPVKTNFAILNQI